MKYTILISALIFLTGCVGDRTESLYDYVDPEGYVVVRETDAREFEYDESNVVSLSNGNILVKKSLFSRYSGYVILAIASPVTITIDSTMYIVEGVGEVVVGRRPQNDSGRSTPGFYLPSISIQLK